MGIEEHYDEVARCNRCGFCQVACPIFRATGHEAGVARGRMALLRGLIEKRLQWDRQLEEPLFECLLCGACTANCFPAVSTADLLLDARCEYLDRVGRNSLHKLLFDHLLPHPRRLRIAARAAALGKRTGLSKVARALGLLRIFGRDFPNAEEIIECFPDKAFRESVNTRVFEGEGELRIGYFVGCGTDIMCPEAANATLGVLRSIAGRVEVLENCCCGLPPLTYGDRTAAQKLAEKNIQLLTDNEFDLIVTDCSSCAAFLKKYPQLFTENDPRHAPAVAVSEIVRDFAELTSISEGDSPIFAAQKSGQSPSYSSIAPKGEKLVVTYHDPCHGLRGQGLVEQPREILRRLPEIEYRELPEADWCCGGAGSYALAHFDLARKVLDRKMDNLKRTDANLLVTSCPACIIHLSYGVRKRGLQVRVCHISELIAAHLTCPS